MTPTESLLRYRPWTGTLRPPVFGAWALARVSLVLLMRRKLFWLLYALAGLIFFFFFYGQYLIVWVRQQTEGQSVPVLGVPVKIGEILKFLDRLGLDGSAHTFGNFVWFQGYISMIVLALAGSVLVGNDFQYKSLSFYLAKPIGRGHYILGKCLGVGLFVHLLTTVPAFVLWIQAGLLYDWRSYYLGHLRELVGLVGYGTVLAVTLSLLLMATSVLLRRTVPLVMAWTGIFVLGRMLGGFLVEGQRFHPAWRLIDLWNDLYLLGLWCLGATDLGLPGTQPPTWTAALVVLGVTLGSAQFLARRVRGVEVVS